MTDKTISVYGKRLKETTYRQRYWKKRKDGIKQRYWKTVTRKQRVGKERRFDMTGRAKDLQKAVATIKREDLVPIKRHEEFDVPEDFYYWSEEEQEEYMRQYGEEGEWREEEES